MATRNESVATMSLDGIDVLLVVLGGAGLFLITSALGIDSTKVRGGFVIAGLMIGPLGRRALIEPPPPYQLHRSKLIAFLGFVVIATGGLVAAMGALLLYFRHSDNDPMGGAALCAGVGVAILVLGTIVDYSQRDRTV